MTAAFDQVAMGLDADTPVLLASVSEPDAIRVLLIKDGAIDVIGRSPSSEVLARRLSGTVKTFGRADQRRRTHNLRQLLYGPM